LYEISSSVYFLNVAVGQVLRRLQAFHLTFIPIAKTCHQTVTRAKDDPRIPEQVVRKIGVAVHPVLTASTSLHNNR